MFGSMQPAPLSVARILDHATVRHPDAQITVVAPDGTRSVTTFAQTGARAAATAHALDHLGVEPGTVVASLAVNSAEHLEVALATSSMGAVFHPANPLLPVPDLLQVLTQSSPTVLVVDPDKVGLLERILPELPGVTDVLVFGEHPPEVPIDARVHLHEEILDGCPTEFPWPVIDESSAAAIAFTSGTTGPPRGVAYSHRSIWLHSMQLCMAESMAFSPADTILLSIPMFHVMAWGIPFAALMTGSSLVLPAPQPDGPHPSGLTVARAITGGRPNKALLTPSLAAELLTVLRELSLDITGLKEIFVGGSSMPPTLWEEYWNRHSISLSQAWGMTETSPVGTVARPAPRASATKRRQQILGHGRFPAALEARLVDAGGIVSEDGASLGELEVRGPWVTASYLGDPDDEAGAFDDGWLRTGDVASLSGDGYLTLSDRVGDVIHSGGEWISTVLLENAVMRDTRVAQAAVIGVPDTKWGARPLAVVVLKPDVTDDPLDTARALWESLDDTVDVWMRPDHWTFTDSIPRNPVGKFDKKTIREQHAAGDYTIYTVS